METFPLILVFLLIRSILQGICPLSKTYHVDSNGRLINLEMMQHYNGLLDELRYCSNIEDLDNVFGSIDYFSTKWGGNELWERLYESYVEKHNKSLNKTNIQ